jgi:hypothetical protein
MVSQHQTATTTAGCFGSSLCVINQVTAIQQPHLLYPYVLASGSGVPVQPDMYTSATQHKPTSNRVMQLITHVCQQLFSRKDGVLCNPIS